MYIYWINVAPQRHQNGTKKLNISEDNVISGTSKQQTIYVKMLTKVE